MTTVRNGVHPGDCIQGMASLEAGSVDLVFADPPFNIGYDYDAYDDRQEREHYLTWSRDWMRAVHRVLKADGTFWLAIGDEYAAELKLIAQNAYPGLPLLDSADNGQPARAKGARRGRGRPPRDESGGFICRSWVVWYYTFGVHCTHKFTRSHAHLFHFVKDPKQFTFNAAEVRVPSARQLVYNDARANPEGRMPDDTWIIPPHVPGKVELRPQDLPDGFASGDDTWYFARVAGTFGERQGWHGCQMPEQLLGRIVRACSNEGETVLDPFTGSGTTLAVARKLRRIPVGFELSAQYAAEASRRLAEVRPGDPLVGPEDPRVSAPATAGRENGRRGRPEPRARSRMKSGPAGLFADSQGEVAPGPAR